MDDVAALALVPWYRSAARWPVEVDSSMTSPPRAPRSTHRPGATRPKLAAACPLRILAVGAALLIALLPVTACSGSSDKAGGKVQPPVSVLRLVNPRGTFEVQPFLDQLSAVSGGQLIAEGEERFERDSLHAEGDAVRLLQSGQADLGVIPARAFDDLGVTEFDALLAPMEINTMALQAKVLGSDVATDMLSGVQRLGLVGLGVLPGPMRLPAGISRPLVAPGDYAGARIGVATSAMTERSLRALGAKPVRTTFEGADISGFDGIESQVAAIIGNQYDGVVRWITANVTLWPRPLVLVANAAKFASLTDTQRGWLRDAARNAIPPTVAVQLDTADATLMCRRGRVRIVLATPAETAELRRGFEPVYRILRRQTTTADFLNRIERLKAEVSPDPNEILDCARLAPPSAARTTPGDRESASAVNGQYILTLTTADVLALGGDSTIKENYGEFRLVLDNGRWVSTQRNPPACTWSYGTYSVTDGRIELVVIDAGGMAPTHSASKAGEVAAYTVSRYRGTMRWSTVSDASSPEGVAYKPWRRQPDRPPRQFLDRHCTPPDAAFAH